MESSKDFKARMNAYRIKSAKKAAEYKKQQEEYKNANMDK